MGANRTFLFVKYIDASCKYSSIQNFYFVKGPLLCFNHLEALSDGVLQMAEEPAKAI